MTADDEAERKGVVHDFIFEDMPGVIGLAFNSSADRQWPFSGELDLGTPGSDESFRTFVGAAVTKFKVEGTLDSGDVLIVCFDPSATDLWLSPGIRLCASAKPGKVWAQLNGFILTPAATSALAAAGWEIRAPGTPSAYAIREWWIRQADEMTLEILWIIDAVAGYGPDHTVRIIGSDPAVEAWNEVTGSD